MASNARLSCFPSHGFFRNPLEGKAIGGRRMEIQFRCQSSLRGAFYARSWGALASPGGCFAPRRRLEILCDVARGICDGVLVVFSFSDLDAMGGNTSANQRSRC